MFATIRTLLQSLFRSRQLPEVSNEFDSSFRPPLAVSQHLSTANLSPARKGGARPFKFWDRLRTDLRSSFRSLAKNPMFTTLAVSMLALGISSNTIVYSIVNGVLLKPLPYDHADRIYSVRTVLPRFAHLYPDLPVNGRHFEEWRKQCSACESMTLIRTATFNLEDAGEPQRVEALLATHEILDMLGTKLQIGRSFTEAEDQPEANRVIVISNDLWWRSFGGDPRVIGSKVIWNQTPVEIIGVLPTDFRFPSGDQMGAIYSLPTHIDAIRPLGLKLSSLDPSGGFNFVALVQLKAHAGVEQALTEMNRSLASYSKEAGPGVHILLSPLKEKMTGKLRGPLVLL